MIKRSTLIQIVPTSAACYADQGPGVGAGKFTMHAQQQLIRRGMEPNCVCMDIGFGDGQSLQEILDTVNGVHCIGIDIAPQCRKVEMRVPDGCSFESRFLDVCHEPLPLPDNSVDYAFCTETIEHLANPYHMVAEVKRVLKHNGVFTLAFPMPENNLGYGGGQHAHVYPGFLTRKSFETFMRQMFFAQLGRFTNGASAWYSFANYKGEGIVDVFEVVSGNYDEQELYGLLDDFGKDFR